MAQNDRVQRVLLQWEQDQQALKRTMQGNAQISGSIQTVASQQQQLQKTTVLLQAEFDKVGRGRQFDALALNFAKARAEGKDTTAEVERLTRALQALGATKDEIAGVVREASRLGDEIERSEGAAGGSRFGSGGRLGRIGSELRQLPSVQTGLGFGTDAVANVIRVAGAANSVLQGTGVALNTIALAGGLAGGALIAVIAAFSAVTSEIDRQKNAVVALVAANRLRYEQERILTTEQAQASLRALEITRDAAQQALDDAKRAKDAAVASYRQPLLSVASYGDASFIASIAANLFSGVDTAIAEAQKAYDDAQVAVDGMNISLGNNAFAAQDATEAERKLAEARTQATLQNAALARELSVTQSQYSRFTGTQAQSELQRLRDDNQGLFAARRELQNSGDTSGDATAQIAAYSAEIQKNQFLIGRLMNEYLPLAEQRDREAQALKDMVKASEELNKARTKVQDAEAALANEYARNADAVSKINADFVDKQAEIALKASAAIAEAELDAEQGRTKAADDAGKRRVEAQRKADESLLKAQREFNRSFGNAVANRDALAAYEAKQAFDDEKADIKSALKEQKREIEDAYKEQLRTVDARLRDQLRVIDQRKREELRLAEKAANAALTLEAQKHNAEISMRQQALNAAVQQYNTFLAALQAAALTYRPPSITPRPTNPLIPQQIIAPYGSQAFQDYTRGMGIPGFATGLNRVPRDNFLARLHQDEAVLNKQEARMWREGKTNGSGMVFAPVINGSNRQQIKRQFDEHLERYLDAAGL